MLIENVYQDNQKFLTLAIFLFRLINTIVIVVEFADVQTQNEKARVYFLLY